MSQSPVLEMRKSKQTRGDPHRKNDTETGNRTFGLSFQSSGKTTPIFYQNSLIYQKKGFRIFLPMLFSSVYISK